MHLGVRRGNNRIHRFKLGRSTSRPEAREWAENSPHERGCRCCRRSRADRGHGGRGVVVPDLSLRPVVVGDTLEGALKRAIDHFVTCVLEGKDSSVGPLEGRDALKVALALEESAKSHKPVRLDW